MGIVLIYIISAIAYARLYFFEISEMRHTIHIRPIYRHKTMYNIVGIMSTNITRMVGFVSVSVIKTGLRRGIGDSGSI